MSENDMKIIFMRNLRHYLNKSRKTQIEAAKAIHVSQQTFNTWYNGIAIPRPDKLERLANLFNVDATDLLRESTFERRIRNVVEEDGRTSFIFKDYDGNEMHVAVVEKGKPNPIMEKLSDFASNLRERPEGVKAIPIHESVFTQLSKDEMHLIELYRAGEYKKIVTLMMEKMP